MAIDYKKLLPVSLRTTKWGSFAEAYQSLIATIKEDKIDIIKNQYNLDEMTAEQIKTLAYMFGYTISIYEGYTAELEYLKREIKTIIPRIKNRLIKKGYDYIFYIFNMIGNVLPISYNLENVNPTITWNNQIANSTISFSSEAVGYEWENTLLNNTLSTVGRTTGYNDEWFKFDFSSSDISYVPSLEKTIFNSSETYYHKTIKLSTGKLFIVFRDQGDSNKGKYIVLNNDLTVFQSATKFCNNAVYQASVIELSTGKIFITYINNSTTKGEYVVLNSDFTLFKDVTIFNTNATWYADTIELSTGKIFIIFYEPIDEYGGHYIVLNSDFTVYQADTYLIATAIFHFFYAVELTSGKIIIVFIDNNDINKGKYIVLNDDFTEFKAITIFYSTIGLYRINVIELSTGKIFIGYYADNDYDGFIVLNSDFTIYKDATRFGMAYTSFDVYVPIVELSNGKIITAFCKDSNNDLRFLVLNPDFTIYQEETIFNSTWSSSSDINIIELSYNTILITFCDTDYKGKYTLINVHSDIFIDYVVILNHNFTSTANVTLLGSYDDSTWTTLKEFDITDSISYIFPETQYYIYYKLTIEDINNLDGYNEISKIYLGSYVDLSNLFNTFHIHDDYYTEEAITYGSLLTLDNDPEITLDSNEFQTLDSTYNTDYIRTRNILVSYKPKYVENANEYFSSDTMRAFNEDLSKIKRATERHILEYKLEQDIYYISGSYNTYQENLYTYDDIINPAASLKTFTWDNINFATATEIRMGNLQYEDYDLSSKPSDLRNKILTLNLSLDMNYIIPASNSILRVRKKVENNINILNGLFDYITELGVFNGDDLLCYLKFPKIQFHSSIYSNFQLYLKAIPIDS